jgi:hypothetical protein
MLSVCVYIYIGEKIMFSMCVYIYMFSKIVIYM